MVVAIINFRTVCLSALYLMICGCAASNVDRNYDFGPDGGKGIVFGSITDDKYAGVGQPYSVVYVSGSNGANDFYIKSLEEMLPAVPFFKPSDFESVNGRLFAIELPEGDYELKDWIIVRSNVTISPMEDPEPIRFTVKENEIRYIGNVHFNFGVGENLFGVRMVFSGYPSIQNEHERDFEVFEERYPNLRDEAILMTIPLEGVWSSPEQEMVSNGS